MKRPESLAIGQLLAWTAAIATLAVTPWTSYDPINVPKLAVIATGGFVALGALISNREGFLNPKFRFVQIFGFAFCLDLLVVLFVSGTNTAQEIFGTFGRATGLVAYLSLCFLLIAAAIAASNSVNSRFGWTLVATGGVSIAYGLLQAFGADPLKWVNQYSPVIGFLGNPNFQSSFVGLSAVFVTSLLLTNSARLIIRVGYFTFIVLAIYVIKETHSQQGFLIFAGGIYIVGMIWLYTSKFKVATIPSMIVGIFGFLLVTLGSLNSGPLANLLYKESVTYRGDYWHAGWKMTVEHPFFGVGLDSFGDWYRRARTLEATLRRGPDITSNAAHNVLLDFSANGGFPLMVIYLFMVSLVILAAVRLVKRSNTFDPVTTGLIGTWIAYQAQSIISLNQLGLAVWGWIISGLIIGYEINSRPGSPVDTTKGFVKNGRTASEIAKTKVAPKTAVAMFAGLLIGLLVGLPPLVSSSKFKSALESGNAQTVVDSAYFWPRDSVQMGQVAGMLLENKLEAQGLSVATDAVAKFPDKYELWSLLAKIPSATAEQKAQAQREMKRLDPHNPNLK